MLQFSLNAKFLQSIVWNKVVKFCNNERKQIAIVCLNSILIFFFTTQIQKLLYTSPPVYVSWRLHPHLQAQERIWCLTLEDKNFTSAMWRIQLNCAIRIFAPGVRKAKTHKKNVSISRVEINNDPSCYIIRFIKKLPFQTEHTSKV